MILGFGRPDEVAAATMRRKFAKFLREELSSIHYKDVDYNYVNKLCNQFRAEQPKTTFQNKEYEHLDASYPIGFSQDYTGITCIIKSGYSAYNTNHPLSPDGFACLDFPFTLSFVLRPPDSSWEEKVQVFDC